MSKSHRRKPPRPQTRKEKKRAAAKRKPPIPDAVMEDGIRAWAKEAMNPPEPIVEAAEATPDAETDAPTAE